MQEDLKLLDLPKTGCLRVIETRGEEIIWHEFQLANVLVVVLPDHPVGIEDVSGR